MKIFSLLIFDSYVGFSTHVELIGMLEKYEEENGIIFFPDIMFSPKADDNLIIIDPFIVNTGDFITIIDSNLNDKLSPTKMYVGYDAKKGLELEYLPNTSLLIDQIHSNDKRPEIVGNELTDRDLNKIAYFNILGDGSSYLFSTNEVRYTKFSELYKKYGLEVTFAIYQDKIYPVIKQSLLLDLEKTINVSKGFIGRVGTINGYIPTLIKEYKNDNKMFSDEDYYHFENSSIKNVITNYR